MQASDLAPRSRSDGATAVQRPLLRWRDIATSQLRRSTRLQTMSQPRQQQPMNVVSAAMLQAAPPQLLTQLSYMAPKPSLETEADRGFSHDIASASDASMHRTALIATCAHHGERG